MPALPPALDKLIALLSRLPGVGERTATRFAFHVLNEPDSYARDLSRAFGDILEHVQFCEDCHTLSEDARCRTCRDPGRDRALLCVVESVQDLMAFERTGAWRGLYHVMHGVIAPLKGVGPEDLRLGNLEERLAREGVTEVVIATNTDVEGEATALYLAKRLEQRADTQHVRVTRLATGIPMGGELEYIDQNTLTRALNGRQPIAG